MELVLELNRWVHIVAGFTGLVAFWIPLVAAKGGGWHRRAGRVFRYSAMVVITAALVAVTLHAINALMAGSRVGAEPESWAFLVFLGYLALVTGGILSHGIAVLRHKRDLSELNTPYRRTIAHVLIAASLILVAWALYWQPDNAILLFALSPLGIANGLSMLAVIRGRRVQPLRWKIEHLGAMIGCGIAFHTAFAVFGMNRFATFDLPGVWQVLPWILPAAIGIPAISLLTRYYRRQASATA